MTVLVPRTGSRGDASLWSCASPSATGCYRPVDGSALPLPAWLCLGPRIDDYATGQKARVDFGFAEDIAAIDAADEGWPDVRVPTLIVHGRLDEVVDIELSRTFAAGKRHVRLVELEDRHELTATLPRTLAEAEAFLAPFLGRPA